MDAAQTTITTADAAVGFGLSSFYSSVADAVAMVAVLAVLAMADAVVVTTITIVVNGLSFFLFSSAAVETVVLSANFFTGVASAAPSYIKIMYIFSSTIIS